MAFSWADPSPHVAAIVLCLALLAWHHEATARPDSLTTRTQRRCFWAGIAVLALALCWPVADLAQTTSLLAVILQRQLLVLGAAPLLLLGTPMAVTARLTHPAPLDFICSRLARPVTAIATTTVLLFVTAIPPTIAAASSNAAVRGALVALTLVAGFALWLPVIERVPGVPRLSDTAKAGYLVVQSLAPTFLSFVWIFAREPLYKSLSGQHRVLGISALTDQQLSAYLSKLGTFGVLWTVAYLFFSHASDDEDEEQSPLHWVDVERELERVDRRERRGTLRPDDESAEEGSSE